MKKQAQLIFTHFGEEKQRLKAKEERLELEIALNKLALYDLREEQGICQDVLREELITDCNEEFADNVLMRMQLENLEFDESFEMMCDNYNKCRILHCYGIDNFYFSKEEVRKWVEKKIDRTIERFNIIDMNSIFCKTDKEVFMSIDEASELAKKSFKSEIEEFNKLKNFKLKEGMKFKLTSGNETYIYSKKYRNLPKGIIDWKETKKLNGVE